MWRDANRAGLKAEVTGASIRPRICRKHHGKRRRRARAYETQLFIPRSESRNRSDAIYGKEGRVSGRMNEHAYRSGVVGKLVVIVAAFHGEEMGPD